MTRKSIIQNQKKLKRVNRTKTLILVVGILAFVVGLFMTFGGVGAIDLGNATSAMWEIVFIGVVLTFLGVVCFILISLTNKFSSTLIQTIIQKEFRRIGYFKDRTCTSNSRVVYVKTYIKNGEIVKHYIAFTKTRRHGYLCESYDTETKCSLPLEEREMKVCKKVISLLNSQNLEND